MLTKQQHTTLKGRLTRAKKLGPQAVLDEVDYAYGIFDADGWPDTWHTWNAAKSSAEMELARASW